MLGFMIGVFLFAGTLAGLILGVRGLAKNKGYVRNAKAGKIGIAVALICAVLLALVPMSIHTVDTGEVAVVKYLGDARNVRTAGTHFDFWLTREYQVYDAKVQNVDISTNTYSREPYCRAISITLSLMI